MMMLVAFAGVSSSYMPVSYILLSAIMLAAPLTRIISHPPILKGCPELFGEASMKTVITVSAYERLSATSTSTGLIIFVGTIKDLKEPLISINPSGLLLYISVGTVAYYSMEASSAFTKRMRFPLNNATNIERQSFLFLKILALFILLYFY